ncbi:MAG: inovirus-type Gp2 protein [Gammaproteobacteria bacterium]|nr:inovirus-type Gp2 protein [Gammaproteobacteria bacterium]
MCPNITGGFDIAVLTYKNTGEAMTHKASSFTEMPKKGRLFLISNEATNKYTSTTKREVVGTFLKPNRTINRKKIIFEKTFTHNGKTYSVNTEKSGLYLEIMKAIVEQFEIAVSKWRRVFVLRFDLHSHIHTHDNKQMTLFRKRLFQKLKRVYGFNDIGFCWVREQERAKAQHYHWVLFLAGDLIRHSTRINAIIKETWEDQRGNNTMPTIGHPYYFVDNDQVAQEAVYRVSYLAKPRGKGYRGKQVKDFQCSRMKWGGVVKSSWINQ